MKQFTTGDALDIRPRTRSSKIIPALLLLAASAAAQAQAAPGVTNFVHDTVKPLEYGVFVQGGFGVTEDRGNFKFMMVGAQGGKVLSPTVGHGLLRGNFEYAVQVMPFWQSYTPVMQRQNCLPVAGTNGQTVYCSNYFNVGGTFTGASITPVIFRWNFAGTRRLVPWAQGAGGLLWTNHKYPAYGGPPSYAPGSTVTGDPGSYVNNSSSANTSVWNFTPQFGVGARYFLRPNRSLDFAANAIHISSASLGDRNPGVNASVQFSLGYTWWK
jgi:lipid A 3-O-deacylase